MQSLPACIGSLILLSSSVAAADGSAPGPITVYQVNDGYESVKENLEMAIAEQGLLVTSTLHIQDMLERTAGDLGFEGKPVYLKAESLEFCSAQLSHLMTRADPRNLAICPFTIAVYVRPETPERVYVAYRRPVLAGDSREAEDAVLEVLEGIARAATE